MTTITFYYCNKAANLFNGDESIWNYFGFPSLRGHINNKNECDLIYLLDSNEMEMFNKESFKAIREYNMQNFQSGKKYDFTCTLKVELYPVSKYKNTYKIVSCKVHEERFCSAK